MRRNCFCDDLCAMYGDCCIDARAYNKQEQATNFLNFGCVHLRHFGDLYMRHKCLPGAADEDVRRACEEGPSAYADPFGSMPVTSTVSYTTLQSVRIRVWLVTGSEPNFHFRASSTLELGLSI